MSEDSSSGKKVAPYEGPSDSVVASSNRMNDIHPYCDILYQTEPHKWGGIMPQDFPVNGTREQEEAFLREHFTEEEIHMQGGAGREGLGFRFLKQVWWSIAIYNFEQRLPATVKWWFESRKDEINDPKIAAWLHNPTATSSTFFLQAEYDCFGEKFLEVVAKAIKWTLREQREQQTSPTGAAPLSATSTRTEPQHAIGGTQAPATITEEDIAPKPAPLPLKPTANAFDSQNNAAEFAARVFNGDVMSMPDHRSQQHRKRGSYNKRSSFHDPTGFRPRRDISGPNYPGTHTGYAQPPPGFGPMPSYTQSGQARAPSFNIMPNMQAMPDQQMPPNFASGVYDPSLTFHMPPEAHAMMPSPAGYGGFSNGAPLSRSYQERQPFGERTNGQHPAYGNFDGPRGRRESVTSKGGKRGAFSNSIRGGRSGRARNSYGGDARLSLRHSSNDFNAPIDDSHANNRPFSNVNHDKYRQESWRAHKQDENTMPAPRFALQPQSSSKLAPDPYVASATKDEFHCSRDWIGRDCTYVNKVIAFHVPFAVPETAMVGFFSRFGSVYKVSRNEPRHGSKFADDPMVYVNFDSNEGAKGARACLRAPNELPWPGVRIEVPREYWDPNHPRYHYYHSEAPRPPYSFVQVPDTRQREPSAQPSESAQPGRISADAASQLSQSHKTATGSEDLSEDHTPTVSGAATPDPKKKNKGKKNKNKKTGLYQESLNPAFETNGLAKEEVPDTVVEDKISKNDDHGQGMGKGKGKLIDTPMQPTPLHDRSLKIETAEPERPKPDTTTASLPLADVASSTIEAEHKAVDVEVEVTQPSPDLGLREPETVVVQPSAPSLDSKVEDEPAEDSFHTASSGPDEAREESVQTVSPVDIPKSTHQKPSAVEISSSPEASKQTSPEPSIQAATTPHKEGKKAVVPQISPNKPPITVAIPKPIEHKPTSARSETTQGEAGSTEPQPVSGLSVDGNSAYKTAPTTPAIPEPSQAKKPAKQKGAAQTESLSVFGSKSKKKGGKKKAIVHPHPPEKPRTTSTNDASGDPSSQHPTRPPKSPPVQPEKILEEEKPMSSLQKQTQSVMTTAVNDTACASSKSLLNRVTGFLSFGSQSVSSSQLESQQYTTFDTQAPEIGQKNGAGVPRSISDQAGAEPSDQAIATPVGEEDYEVQGIPNEPRPADIPTTDGTAQATKLVKSKKSNKPKKNKNTGKNNSQAEINASEADASKIEAQREDSKISEQPFQAEVAEMSHPVRNNESKMPVLSIRGSQALGHDPASAPEQSSASPLPSPSRSSARNFLPIRGQPPHLVTMEPSKPVKRRHPRIRSGRSSDTTSSGDEKTLTLRKASNTEQNKIKDTVQQALGARFPTGQESVGLGLGPLQHQVIPGTKMDRLAKYGEADEQMPLSDEVKRAQEKMRQDLEKEKKIKQQKELEKAGKLNAK